jgi:ABC-type nitrate/sulfonate/bicarbonate transport system permease component
MSDPISHEKEAKNQQPENASSATDKKQGSREKARGAFSGAGDFFSHFLKIRDEPTLFGRVAMALSCLGLVLIGWFLATRGTAEERLLSINTIGSPEEVFGSFGSLWFERALMRNLLVSLWRVIQGFGLAALIGIPLGILCGTFNRLNAFFSPISIFGRNVPISALCPLTLVLFGMGETQMIGFIFIACVAFVLFDVTRSISDVEKDYLDTAYTLGASRTQVIGKVLIPLALPDIFNSIRLLFGLAFGYIVLAEAFGAETGVGRLIWLSQRRGPLNHVYLILIFITLVAFSLDRVLYSVQKHLFPYRFGRH